MKRLTETRASRGHVSRPMVYPDLVVGIASRVEKPLFHSIRKRPAAPEGQTCLLTVQAKGWSAAELEPVLLLKLPTRTPGIGSRFLLEEMANIPSGSPRGTVPPATSAKCFAGTVHRRRGSGAWVPPRTALLSFVACRAIVTTPVMAPVSGLQCHQDRRAQSGQRETAWLTSTHRGLPEYATIPRKCARHAHPEPL